jgi:hypothetical protein
MGGPGFRIPAHLLWTAALLVAAPAAHAQAPVPAPTQAQAAQAAMPDPLVVTKLVWSSLAALDHANRTGNYSVLRDLGAPSFQANNTSATLGAIFQSLRTQQIDLSNVLLVAPNYDFAPAIIQGGLLRIRGAFPLRPVAVGFDLLFQHVGGEWRLFGMAVAPVVPQTLPANPRPATKR